MKCPKCNCKSTVKDASFNKDDNEYYRKRECKECGHIFYTIEFEVACDESFLESWHGHYRNWRRDKKLNLER